MREHTWERASKSVYVIGWYNWICHGCRADVHSPEAPRGGHGIVRRLTTVAVGMVDWEDTGVLEDCEAESVRRVLEA